MDPAAHQNQTNTIDGNGGNVADGYGNARDIRERSVEDKKGQILEWLSPMEPRERHQAVREHRVDGVGDWLLRTNEFKNWHTSDDRAIHPVLFCYGDPGVGSIKLIHYYVNGDIAKKAYSHQQQYNPEVRQLNQTIPQYIWKVPPARHVGNHHRNPNARPEHGYLLNKNKTKPWADPSRSPLSKHKSINTTTGNPVSLALTQTI